MCDVFSLIATCLPKHSSTAANVNERLCDNVLAMRSFAKIDVFDQTSWHRKAFEYKGTAEY